MAVESNIAALQVELFGHRLHRVGQLLRLDSPIEAPGEQGQRGERHIFRHARIHHQALVPPILGQKPHSSR